MNTDEGIFLLRSELNELADNLDAWRDRLALQEELAFYTAAVEELARRLIILEKKVAQDRNGECVPIA